MTDQPTLFDADEIDIGCLYPQLAGVTSYTYGCRCMRCRNAKYLRKQIYATGVCQAEDCGEHRMKHRRWCPQHEPPPAQRRPPQVRVEASCELCGRTHGWYESVLEWNTRFELRDLYRRTCGPCRKGYIAVIKGHHLNTRWAMRLILASNCELCGDRFPVDKHGRRRSVVDHNHLHCPATTSCGECVRGVICSKCNTHVGTVEQINKGIGLDAILRYIASSPLP